MNVVATADQRRSDQDRAGRVSLALDSVPTQADDSNRAEVRAEIRRILDEIEADRGEVEELRLYREKCEGELAAAEEQHQSEAAKIQKTLAKPQLTTEQRIDARRELATINQALQQKCDDINSRIAACDDEISEMFLSTCRADKAAKALRTTAEPSLLAELEAAEIVSKAVSAIATRAAADLEEHRATVRYHEELAQKRTEQQAWLPNRLKGKLEKELGATSNSAREPSAAEMKLSAIAKAAREIASIQSAKVAELTRQVLES